VRTTSVVVIGAGPAGLAMSRCLTDRSIDHVVLERGRVAERWHSERWDSLRLLTPNWQTRLPGWTYRGDDPDGYMTAVEVADYFTGYATSFAAPVEEQTTVLSVRRDDAGYEVDTDRGGWRASAVVIAVGAAGTPFVPPMADGLPAGVVQVTPNRYRSPEQLPEGGVLVVGASASGIQLASEIHASGRDVLLAFGAHRRLPRRYRGLDIQHWLDLIGLLDMRYDQVPNIDAARRAPSLQLVGTPDGRSLDLGLLQDRGVRLAGRLLDASGGSLTFAGDLARSVVAADHVQMRLLDSIDAYIAERGLQAEVDDVHRPPRVHPEDSPHRVGLADDRIRTVVWATGFRPDYPWLDVPVLDARGELVHDGGVVRDAPGLYVLGLRFMRRRKSSFIDGFGSDAMDLCAHLASHLDRTSVRR
jgi:putative flavoprotein involved in K+ transport